MYSPDMKLARLGLQPSVQLKGVPSGAEFAQFLVSEASIDSVKIRTKIEEACFRDLSAYFDMKKIAHSREWLGLLIKAELAGGSFASLNMPERLKRQLDQESAISIAEIAADISILLNTKRSDFNYFRYSLNAVVTVMGSLFKEDLFEIPGITKNDISSLQKSLREVLEMRLDDSEKLMAWLEQVTNLHYKVIELHNLENSEKQEKPRNTETDKLKKLRETHKTKSNVSTKSMSTYRLRVFDYAILKSQQFLKTSKNSNSHLEFGKRLDQALSYREMNSQTIKKLIDETSSRKDLVEKYSTNSTETSGLKDEPLVSVRENLTKQNVLNISYSGSRVSSILINPVLKSLKSQLLLTPNQKKWRSEARSGEDYLSIELDSLKTEDLIKIEKILQLHSE